MSPEKSNVRPKNAFSGAFAKAVSLASQGHLDEAIEELEQGVNGGEDPVEIHSGLGHLRFEQQNWAESAHHYGEVAKAEPGHPTASYNLALCWERLGKYEEAAAAFAAGRAIDPKRWQAAMGRGMCLLRLGANSREIAEFSATALGCLDDAIEQSAGLLAESVGRQDEAKGSGGRSRLERAQHVLLFGRALALHQLGRRQEAGAIYESLVPSHPESTDLLANLVAIAIDEKQWALVEELSGRLIDLEPTSQAALQGLVLAALRRGDFHSAILYGVEAVKQFPGHVESWLNLGCAYEEAGQDGEAREAYDQALRLEPSAPGVNLSLGAWAQRHQDLVGARLAYRRVLAVSPNSVGALWNLALVCSQEGNQAEAERLFGRVVALQPDWRDAVYRIAVLQLARGDWESAVDSLRAFLKLTLAKQQTGVDGSNADQALQRDARFNLGVALRKAGYLEEAAEQFSKVLESKSDEEAALQALTLVQCELGNAEKTLTHYKSVVALGAVPAELSFNVGLLLLECGDAQSAQACFQRALEGDSTLVPALVNKGLLLHQDGKEDQAMFLWSDALRLEPQLALGYFA